MCAQTKTAFTRKYNTGSHKSQALGAEQGVGKKRKKAFVAGNEFGEDEEESDDDDAVDEYLYG